VKITPIHAQLLGDSLHADEWSLCYVRILNDARWPWLILIPDLPGARELHDLSASDRAILMSEMTRATRLLAAWPGVEKVNVGALGNIVPQLHVHVIGRWAGDPAWPGPVWGVAGRQPYAADDRSLADLRAAVSAR
jgi:diadenosine tetraphosphate (Ap4A) HIT family hydrolase